MYSAAALPSSIRAAPAKNRMWSTDGGISSLIVIASGLPVFWLSTATNSSARDSIASAMRSSASWRVDGVESRHDSNAVGGRGHGSIDIGGTGDRGTREFLARGGIDQVGVAAILRFDVLAIDKVPQIAHVDLLNVTV